MSELITKQAMKDMITNHRSDFSDAANYRTALVCVDAVPPIQPEIVRCKDCKYFDSECHYCDYFQWNITNDNFCSKAERREDG